MLVVCPASLRINWQREWKRWCVYPCRPVIVTDAWPLALAKPDLLAEPVAAILSYEGLVKWQATARNLEWDLVIADEIHYAKSGKAKRSRALFGGGKGGRYGNEGLEPLKAKRFLGLSGTPIVNRPEELWPLVHALDPSDLGKNRKDYWTRYIEPPMVPRGLYGKAAIDYVKQTTAYRLGELHDRLRAGIMVRRLKADVLTELPAKRRQIVLLDPEGMGDVLRAEREAVSRMASEARQKAEELRRLQAGGDDPALREAVQRLRQWRGAAMTELSRIRHEMAVAKLPAVIDHMFSILEECPKAVFFGWHHDVIDGIAAALPGGTVTFDGRKTPEERDKAVRQFQENPAIRLFVGSIGAAGLGITLTAAQVVCFAELSWTPASMTQAEDRLHRIGQKGSVHVQHLVVDGSIDQKMAALLIEKAAIIDAALDGKMPESATLSILDGVLK